MKRSLFLMAVAAALAAPAAQAKDIHKAPPPAEFKKVSSLVELPDYIPGLGSLYVNPSTLPVGPYLAYDKAGKLVNVTYMVPLKQFDDRKSLDGLGAATAGLRIDHTDVAFNPGHPGLMEPHYHITEWLISKSAQEKM
jgi:hypothetical protein